MSISKKDFEAIAAALRTSRPAPFTLNDNDLQLGKTIAWEQCCIAIANSLSTLNPRFRRDLFLAACQAPQEPYNAS